MLATKYNIGEFDEKIFFQEKIIIDNAYNEDKLEGWDYLNGFSWSKVIQKPGREVYQADRLTHVQTFVFVLRYRRDVSVLNRVIWLKQVYNILSIIDTGRKRFLEITAELVDNERVS